MQGDLDHFVPDNDVIDPLFCPDRITKAVETKTLARYNKKNFFKKLSFWIPKNLLDSNRF